MPEMKEIKRVYFIGIGGIGMSALARYFRSLGKAVSGYDKTQTALTKALMQEGIPVHYEDLGTEAPADADLVVYTPAIPDSMGELVYYRNNGYPVMKRSEVLGLITKSSFNIAIAGTHGKTTVTTMVAHLLRHSGYGCNAFLGGIAANYNSNFWSNERNLSVMEADEYDRSFLQLNPDIAVITSMDADHLDIYGTPEAVEEAFVAFSRKLKPGGLLIRKGNLKRGIELESHRTLTYSLNEESTDWKAADIRPQDAGYRFTVVSPGGSLTNLVLPMGGWHNIENAVAAVAVASELGIEGDAIRSALAAFKGVRRRFEYIVRQKDRVYIDDYAHHPEELSALIRGARNLFPDHYCLLLFQPHLFSRTRDLASEFARSLAMADEIWLLPIYPARELPIAGVNSEMIASRIEGSKVKLAEKENIVALIKERLPEKKRWLLITAGAGDIDTLVEPIARMLESNR